MLSIIYLLLLVFCLTAIWSYWYLVLLVFKSYWYLSLLAFGLTSIGRYWYLVLLVLVATGLGVTGIWSYWYLVLLVLEHPLTHPPTEGH